MEKKLSHTDESGKASMVDVGNKQPMHRIALAEGKIYMQRNALELVKENKVKKGDVLTVAQIAGIQAAKKTSELIPLCHPLLLNYIQVDCSIQADHIYVTSEIRCDEKTGVEMEALTAVQVALLTIYDMCKAVDKSMVISEVKLLKKTKETIA